MKATRFRHLAACIPLMLMTSCAMLQRDETGPDEEFEFDDPGAPEIVVPAGGTIPTGPTGASGDRVEVADMRIRVGRSTRTVTFKLLADNAPQTVANFRGLANDGFYRGLAVHRALPGFLVQTGDPLTRDDAQRNEWGTGGPGHTVPAEIGLPHVRGAVAMARLRDEVNPRRESNGSQFYFVLTDLPELDGRYTVFGEVISGMDVLEEISRAVVDTNDAPVERFEIRSIEVRQLPAGRASALAESDAQRSTTGRRATRGSSDRGPVSRFLERYW